MTELEQVPFSGSFIGAALFRARLDRWARKRPWLHISWKSHPKDWTVAVIYGEPRFVLPIRGAA